MKDALSYHQVQDKLSWKYCSQVDLCGYAVAGGGRGIERVDVSIDNGKSWMEARRLPKLQIDAKNDSHRPDWAWTLWELKNVKVETPCTVIVKAVCYSTSRDITAMHAILVL